MVAKVLQFEVTEGVLKRRVHRACTKAEQDMFDKAEWLYQITAGFIDPMPGYDEPVEDDEL